VRQGWISGEEPLPIARQCRLAGVNRATHYAHQRPPPVAEDDLQMLRLIDEEYTRHPFFGSRRRVIFLRNQGWPVNRKRVQRLMNHLGLAGWVPGPHTSQPHPMHPVYPYLLRGVEVVRPNQVWSTDIMYLRLVRGFVYLVAILDWYSRKVLAWRLSNTMDTAFCIACFQDAVNRFDSPAIFNTDQGAQFTSQEFVETLKSFPLQISRDGRGRVADNIFVERLWRTVKYKDVYLKDYATLPEAQAGLKAYFAFYNAERAHQSLGYRTPDVVYATGQGGGAKIVDRFSGTSTEVPAPPPL
jgi:putative transposase